MEREGLCVRCEVLGIETVTDNFVEDDFGSLIPLCIECEKAVKEVIEDNYSLILYGYYQYTGLRGFFKKVRQGIKARNNV